MNPFVITFGIVLAVAILEYVLTLKWSAGYFATGIPIFWRRIDRPSGLGDVDLDDLQKRSATFAGAPILFHRFDAERIGFREKSFAGSIHYIPLMRGLIRHRREESSVMVLGLVKWWAVLLIAAFAFHMGRHIVDVLLYIGIAFGVLYLIQSVRFARMARGLRP